MPSDRTTGRELEELTADRFAMVLGDEGKELGPRERRDGDGLRVDFVYESAQPPIALEITRLVDPQRLALSSALEKLERNLKQVTGTGDLGSWIIAIREGSTVTRLQPEIVGLMEGSRHLSSIMYARRGSDLDAEPLPHNAEHLGLVAALKRPGDSDVHVMPQIAMESAQGSGFSEQLTGCILDKTSVLSEARPRETHLAVVVENPSLVADANSSPAPELCEEIDVLWVFLSDFLAPRRGYRVWRAARGESAWTLLWRPLTAEDPWWPDPRG